MKHWLDHVVDLLEADTLDLRELALKSRDDPTNFYVGASMMGVDLRGQDLRGLRFSDLNGAITDETTRLDSAESVGEMEAEPEPELDELQIESLAVPEQPGGGLWRSQEDLLSRNDGASFWAVDAGNSKVVCAVSRLAQRRDHASFPLSAVGWSDIKAGEKRADREAALTVGLTDVVQQMQRSVNVKFPSVSLATSGSFQSVVVNCEVVVATRRVADADIMKAVKIGTESIRSSHSNFRAIHAFPIQWYIDDGVPVDDPYNVKAEKLSLKLIVILLDRARAKSLNDAAGSARLRIREIVAAPLVTALAVSSELDRKSDNTVFVDIGYKTTGVVVFSNGQLLHVGSFSIGGHHVTQSIASELDVPEWIAELAKRRVGNARGTFPAERERYVMMEGLDGPVRIDKGLLNAVIAKTARALADAVLMHLREHGIDPRIFTICGGGARLEGIRETFESQLKLPVRLAEPHGWKSPRSDDIQTNILAAAGVLKREYYGPRENYWSQPWR